LIRRLSDIEIGNGFANRVMWGCARRSKMLPQGGGSTGDSSAILRTLQEATRKARQLADTRIKFDQEAASLWDQVYADLSEGRPGLFGAVTSRAEAHVVRLSLIYALLDGRQEIRLAHLRAALAVWNYSVASARYIWGDALGDPSADEMLRALKASTDGLTRWDISNHFGRNKSATEIDRALNVLAERGLIRSAREETGERGRTGTRYWAV
jgi:hypothetical protein